MTEAEAIGIAESARGSHHVPETWAALSAERRYILVAGTVPEQPAPVRDVLAWVIRFGDRRFHAELAVDDRTGAVLRVERSR